MDAATLGTMRRLRIFTPIWDSHDQGRLELDDPDVRFQFLRACRDAEEFDRSLPLLYPLPESSPRLLSERLATFDKIGYRDRLAAGLTAAAGLLDDPPGDRPDPTLACAVARAQASFGDLRGGLRTIRPFRDRLTDPGPAFNIHMFLLVRLGWYRAAWKLADDARDVERVPEDEESLIQQLGRLVSAARGLLRIGDPEGAFRAHRRVGELAEQLSASTGIGYQWGWRWHAFALRTTSQWDAHDDLMRAAKRPLLWDSPLNPRPNAKVHDSPQLQVELAMKALSLFDGADTGPLRRAVRSLDATAAVYGDSAELAQAKAALLHQLDDDQALLEHLRRHPRNAPSRIEHVRMLAERGLLAQARAAAERLHREQSTQPETLALRVAVDAKTLHPRGADEPPLASAAELLDRYPEDAQTLAIAAEKLAESGHFADSGRIFEHLTADNPVYGLGWAGRIRAAAWNHDWDLVDRIDTEFAHRVITAEDEALSRSSQLSLYWFAVARALTCATQTDLAGADASLADAARDWRHRIAPGLKSASTDPLWAWTVEQHLWRYRIREAEDQCEESVQHAPRNPYLLVKYGWVLVERHDLARAEEVFRRALAVRPESSGAWKGLIRTLRFQLRFADADACAVRARRVLRANPDVWCEHAHLLIGAHDLDGARAVLEDALRFAPNHANALAMYIRCLSHQRDHQRAIAEAESACGRRPESIEVWEAHCMALLRRGWDKQALLTVGRARAAIEARASAAPGASSRDLNLDLLDASIVAQCGAEPSVCDVVVRRLGRHARSVAATATAAGLLRHHLRLREARELVESFPGWEHEFDLLCEHAEIAAAYGPDWTPSPAGRDARAEVLDDRLGYSQSEYDLAMARRLHPYAVAVVRRQVHLWNARRRFEDSAMLLQRAGGRLRGHFVIEMLKAETDLMRGRPETAVRICESTMERFERPQHLPIWLRITHLRSIRATGRIHDALALARALVEDYPTSRRALLTLARSLEDVNHTSEALDRLQQCLRELPAFPPVGENAALFCRLRGEFDRGRDLVMESLRHLDYTDSPDEAMPRADAGLLAELVLILVNDKRNHPWAEHYIDVLLARDDVHSQSLGHISAGWFAVYRGDLARAEAEFEKTLRTEMCANEARFGLGQTFMLQADRVDDVRERRRLLRRARDIAQQNIDDFDSERSLILAGQTVYQLGNWEEAEWCFRKSIELHPVHGGHLELAVVLNHQGRLTEALAAAERRAECKPDDPKLLATTGLIRVRMVVEGDGDKATLKQGAIDIDRALTLAPADPTVISAVLYASSHADLYEPSTARTYLLRALKHEDNRGSSSSRAHLCLMLAELTLRHGRGVGQNPLNLLRPGAKRWARKAAKGTDDPRALGISASDRRRSRTARIARHRADASGGEAGRKPRGRGPRWTPHVLAATGIGLAVAGAAMMSTGLSPRYTGLVVLAGLGFVCTGVLQSRLSKVRIGMLEMDVSPATEIAGTLNISSTPPLRTVIMPQTAVSQSDAKWRFSESRRQLLGPAVGLMITGHYSYRDANFPWKTG